MSNRLPIEVRFGEIVLIHLDTGDVISGSVRDTTKASIRLSDAFFVKEDPETGKKERVRTEEEVSLGLIEIPFASMMSLQALSTGL